MPIYYYSVKVTTPNNEVSTYTSGAPLAYYEKPAALFYGL